MPSNRGMDEDNVVRLYKRPWIYTVFFAAPRLCTVLQGTWVPELETRAERAWPHVQPHICWKPADRLFLQRRVHLHGAQLNVRAWKQTELVMNVWADVLRPKLCFQHISKLSFLDLFSSNINKSPVLSTMQGWHKDEARGGTHCGYKNLKENFNNSVIKSHFNATFKNIDSANCSL